MTLLGPILSLACCFKVENFKSFRKGLYALSAVLSCKHFPHAALISTLEGSLPPSFFPTVIDNDGLWSKAKVPQNNFKASVISQTHGYFIHLRKLLTLSANYFKAFLFPEGKKFRSPDRSFNSYKARMESVDIIHPSLFLLLCTSTNFPIRGKKRCLG